MGWTSVKDKEKWPKEDEEILLTNGDDIFIGFRSTQDPLCFDAKVKEGSFWYDREFMDQIVSHWMPLPSLPKE